MTNAMKRNPRGGRGPKVMLYALAVLVAILGAALIKTTAVDNNGLAKANLTSFNPITVAPIANQAADTGSPVAPISPTATDDNVSPFPVITWTATGLPPGITISHSSGLITGTPTLAGTFSVTVQARDNARPPSYGSTSFNWFVGNEAPKIDEVVPVVGQGAGGIHVVITGSNFINTTAVDFGGVAAGGIKVNKHGTRMTLVAPTHAAGTVDIRITAIGGTSAVTPSDRFTYEQPAISQIAHAVGPTSGGTRVRITGTGLAGASSVSFGGVASPNFVVRRDGTLLTAVAPVGTPSTVQIVVDTPGGTASSGGNGFTYVTPIVATARHHHK